MDQYRTSGTFNEAAIKETAKIYVPSWYRWLNRVFCAFSFLMFLLSSLVGKDVGFSCFFLFAVAVFVSYPALLRRRHWKLAVTRLTEQAGTSSFRLETFFNVDGLVARNLETDGSVLLRYEDIAYLSESKHCFAIMTRGQQFTLIFKDCLTDEQKKSFIHDMKQRCPKLKVRR